MSLASRNLILATSQLGVYAIAPNITSVNEGGTVVFTVTTEGVDDGTILYWSTSGIDAADFTDNTRTGSVTINSGTGTINRTLSEDLTLEGVETFFLQLRVYSITGPVVATSAVVTVADTSVPSISVTPSTTLVNEGGTVNYTVASSGFPNGTYYYTVQSLSGNVNGSDFLNDSDAQGSFTLTSGSGSFSQTLRLDYSTGEGTESYRINIREGSTSGTIIANSSTITINDTSILSYSVTSNNFTPSEGNTITITTTTTGVESGTTLYYTIQSFGGFTPSTDFTDGAGSGSFTISGSKLSGSGSFTKTLTSDGIIESGESFRVQIRTGSTSGPIVATSSIISVSDAPPTYAVTPDTNTVYEGSSFNTVVFNVTTTNVANGTTLYYTIDGTTESTEFTDGLTAGSFSISSNAGSVTKSIAINLSQTELVDDNEQFRIRIRTGSTSGPIVATSGYVTKRLAYLLTQDPDGLVYEGGTVTYTLTTRSIANGRTISYNIIQGGKAGSISGADFTDGVLTGNLTVSASGSGSTATGTQTFTKTLAYDTLSDSGEDWALLLYDGPNRTGNNVAASANGALDLAVSVSSDPDYSITPDDTTANEGQTVTFDIVTIGVQNGTTLYWTTTGTTNGSDFTDGNLTGSVVVSTGVNNIGSAQITRTLSEDVATEGSESFALQLRTGSTSGPIVATSATVTVADTSQAPTYVIAPNTTTANEGGSVTFTVTTTGVPNGTTLYWTTTGTTAAADFSDTATTGSVTINSNTGSIVRTLTEDAATEGSESFALQLRTGSTSGTIVATSATVTVNDTSIGPTGTPAQAIINTQTVSFFASGTASEGLFVDWGDGSPLEVWTPGQGSRQVSHTYSSVGNHTISWYGAGYFTSWDTTPDLPNAGFTFTQWGDFKPSSGSSLFDSVIITSNQTNKANVFRYTATDVPDLSICTNVFSMFGSNAVFNPSSISNWNTSTITDMQLMFASCSTFNQDLNNWDTSNVTNMAFMFSGCLAFNGNITTWNTAKVTSMRQMFATCTNFNQNIGGWNTANVTDMQRMFSGNTVFNQNIGGWNTAKVTDMNNMFTSTGSFNQNIYSWNTSNVTNMSQMFSAAQSFNQNINGWNTAKVTDMSRMFSVAQVFNGNISGWNTSNLTNAWSMFSSAIAFNQNLSAWNTAKVVTMYQMFNNAESFNGDIGGWNTSNVTNMSRMFAIAQNFNRDLNAWNTSNVTNMSEMFRSAIAFNGNISGWNTNKVTNMFFMFNNAAVFNQNIGSWNVTNVTSMSGMFYSAIQFNQNIAGWNVSNVRGMAEMFRNADSFNINIASWNTANVTNMAYMFQDNGAFDQNISSWQVGSVVDSYRFDFNSNVNWTADEKPVFT